MIEFPVQSRSRLAMPRLSDEDWPGIAEPPGGPAVAEPEEKTDTRTALSGPWKVVVLDDPVNLMPYVVLVFRRIFGFDRDKAHRHMLEVHHKGRSVLWSGARERAEHYHAQLQKAHLSAILERDEG